MINRVWLILRRPVFFKIPESPFCDRRWWRWTAFFRLKIEIFQYKKRIPEDRVRQHSSVYVESMTRMRDLFNFTISSTLSEFFSPLALSLITELFLFLSHFVTFWFQLRRFITDIFKRDERKQVVVDSLVRYVTTEILLTAFHPGLRSLKKSRENTIAFHSIFGRWK